MEKLKPCPFCGASAVEIQVGDGKEAPVAWQIACSDKDGCAVLPFTDCLTERRQAILAWNRRSEGDIMIEKQGAERVHELKTWPVYFRAVEDGSKRFELRINDRDFRVGDILRLREYYPVTKSYSGRTLYMQVDYIAQGVFGLPGDLCVMSISDAAAHLPEKGENR